MDSTQLSEELVRAIPSDARGRALFCCREMANSFEPQRMPLRPIELDALSREEIVAIRSKLETGKLDDSEKKILAVATAYDVSRATVLTDNAARLRGAMWCVLVLRAVAGLEPEFASANNLHVDKSDREVLELGALLQRYMFELYEPPCAISAKTLAHAQVQAAVWQAWARDRTVPVRLSDRWAIADLQTRMMAAYDGGFVRAPSKSLPAQQEALW